MNVDGSSAPSIELMKKRFISLLFVSSLGLVPAVAWGQSSNAAIAEMAFTRGKELMAEGKPGEACPKFEESHRLDPSVGALLNLGRCYEQLGRTASAWVRYKEAATLARSLGQTERETVARDQAKTLEPKLSRVRIEATKRIEGMRITSNGEEVGTALLGDPLPVDPGKLKIEVTAHGYTPWSTELEIGKEADLKSVLIPELKLTVGQPKPDPGAGPMRTTAFVAGVGTGVRTSPIEAARRCHDLARPGVEQQLVRVEAQAALRPPGAVGAQPVDQPRRRARQVAVPDVVRARGQGQAAQLAVAGFVEDAELDALRMRREHGDVEAVAVPVHPERPGVAGLQFSGHVRGSGCPAVEGPARATAPGHDRAPARSSRRRKRSRRCCRRSVRSRC